MSSVTIPAPERTAVRISQIAILITVLLWASAFVAIRHVGHSVGSGPLALGRLLVGAVVLGIVVALRALHGGETTHANPSER
jgi:drug/metabolite transporter (DMT)-like permease